MLAGQIIAALIGVTGTVLDRPMMQANRVLYLAVDRPRQAQRALQRQFGAEHRTVLAERLVVHRGPLVADVVEQPDILRSMAIEHGCDVIIVDSLKDAALKLSDDEVGGGQSYDPLCLQVDIDVGVLHHQRKQ